MNNLWDTRGYKGSPALKTGSLNLVPIQSSSLEWLEGVCY